MAVDELSTDDREELTQFAQQIARALARAGEVVADDEAEHMVHDATTDTMCGVVAWKGGTEMKAHLYSVLRSRFGTRLRRARSRVHVSLDVSTGDAVVAVARDGLEASLGRAQVTHQLYVALRELAAGDTALVSILDAYLAEVTDRRAVMALTGLSLTEFVNARRRLDRMLAVLPPALVHAAREAMREAETTSQILETSSEINP